MPCRRHARNCSHLVATGAPSPGCETVTVRSGCVCRADRRSGVRGLCGGVGGHETDRSIKFMDGLTKICSCLSSWPTTARSTLRLRHFRHCARCAVRLAILPGLAASPSLGPVPQRWHKLSLLVCESTAGVDAQSSSDDESRSLQVGRDVLEALNVTPSEACSASVKRVPAPSLQPWKELRLRLPPEDDAWTTRGGLGGIPSPPSSMEVRFQLSCGRPADVHVWRSDCRCACTLLPRRGPVVLHRGRSLVLRCTVRCSRDEIGDHHQQADRGGARAEADDVHARQELSDWGLVTSTTRIRSEALPSRPAATPPISLAVGGNGAAYEERDEADEPADMLHAALCQLKHPGGASGTKAVRRPSRRRLQPLTSRARPHSRLAYSCMARQAAARPASCDRFASPSSCRCSR